MKGRRPAGASGGALGRQRRALSNVGGDVEVRGDGDAASRLRTCFGGELDADQAREHVHGFHSYPARLHPLIARRMVEHWSRAGGRVVDPFCGSGTVLVEARLAGRAAVGVDLNPLAVALTSLKCRGARADELQALVQQAQRVGEHAEGRRRSRSGASRRYPQEDFELFEPHVLLEVDGVREGIKRLPEGFAKDALWLVFSAILVKVSRRGGDSSDRELGPRRLAAGFVTRLFVAKAGELARRVQEMTSRLPARAPQAVVSVEDARQMTVLRGQSVDLLVSSPPYPGTYDYLEHHRMRLRWLGMDASALEAGEMGARRADGPDAVRRFAEELATVLTAVARVLVPGGAVILVAADSVAGGRAVWAEPLLIASGRAAGLTWLATASQVRPHFHGPTRHLFGREPKREHAVAFGRLVRATGI